MPYIINRTDGTLLTTIPDGEVDTSSDLTLIGKNAATWGEAFNENLVKLLENFSNDTAPPQPLEGQLWYDRDSSRLKIWNESSWVSVGNPISSQSQPINQVIGSLWFKTNTQQLFVYNSLGQWILLGPEAVEGFGETKNTSIALTTRSGTQKPAITTVIDEDIVAVTVNETFELDTATGNSVGFSNLVRGINLKTGTVLKAPTVVANNITGNLTGNVVGLLQGNVLGDVVGNLTGIATNSLQSQNSEQADRLSQPRLINGISFDGTTNITIEDTTKISKSGDVVNGFLTLHADPSSNFHAATKRYVDQKFESISIEDTTKVSKLGDTMQGFLTLSSNPTANLHAATKSYVDSGDSVLTSSINAINTSIGALSASINGKVAKTGDTMSGYLRLHASPIEDLHAATKGYIDQKILEINTGISGLRLSDPTKVSKAGDTMSGLLALSGDPESPNHAATKRYVDNITRVRSLGINADPGPAGELRAAGDIIAFFSDQRLKKNIRPINEALDKINKISGVVYQFNEVAKQNGFDNADQQVGVIAQEIQEVLPEAVKFAPFDRTHDNRSISGENYLTVQYEKLIPLLIEAVKELSLEIDKLKASK